MHHAGFAVYLTEILPAMRNVIHIWSHAESFTHEIQRQLESADPAPLDLNFVKSIAWKMLNVNNTFELLENMGKHV